MVYILVRSKGLERTELRVPVRNKPVEFLVRALEISVFRHDFLSDGAGIVYSEHQHDFFRLARLKLQISLNSSAGVVAVGLRIRASALHNRLRMLVRAVSSDERLTARVESRHRRSYQSDPLAHVRAADFPFRMLDIKVVLNRVAEHIVGHLLALHDEKRILQVDLILSGVPLVREFAVREHADFSCLVGGIRNLEPPVLKILAERNIIFCLGFYSLVFRSDCRICSSVTAFALVLIKRLSDRLP